MHLIKISYGLQRFLAEKIRITFFGITFTFLWSNCEFGMRAGGIEGYRVTKTPESFISAILAAYTPPNSKTGSLSVVMIFSICSLASFMASWFAANKTNWLSESSDNETPVSNSNRFIVDPPKPINLYLLWGGILIFSMTGQHSLLFL